MSNQQKDSRVSGCPVNRKLFVGGLGRQTTKKEIRVYFSKFGYVESVNYKVNKRTGESRGFAFVRFKYEKSLDDLFCDEDTIHYIGSMKITLRRVLFDPLYNKIYVGGLEKATTNQQITDYFAKYGEIAQLDIPINKRKNQRRSFCFVAFMSYEVVQDILKMPNHFINGKEVVVEKFNFNHKAMTSRGGARSGPRMPAYGGGDRGEMFGRRSSPAYGPTYGNFNQNNSYGINSGYCYVGNSEMFGGSGLPAYRPDYRMGSNGVFNGYNSYGIHGPTYGNFNQNNSYGINSGYCYVGDGEIFGGSGLPAYRPDYRMGSNGVFNGYNSYGIHGPTYGNFNQNNSYGINSGYCYVGDSEMFGGSGLPAYRPDYRMGSNGVFNGYNSYGMPECGICGNGGGRWMSVFGDGGIFGGSGMLPNEEF